MKKLSWMLAIFFLLVSSPLLAKQNYQLQRINSSITLDGVLDEPHWQQATFIDLPWEVEPVEGIAAKVKTHAWIYEDGDQLYVAFKAFDPNPEKIRASIRDRDDLWSDDNVILMIDTFNDERTGYQFYVNALGAQADARMTDYGTWMEDPSWDAIWDAKTQISDDGYTVEMIIPFTAIRFPLVEGKQTWGLSLYRNMPREVRNQYSNIKFDYDIKCSFCQFDKLTGLENAKPSKNLQLTPTLTASRNDKRDTGDAWENGDAEFEPGLDIRYGLTSDAILNATINPDFSQIEADAGQLDVNTTFALFYEEKRPFFLDGADSFETELLNLVHTRNIADPDVGAKITGKSGVHSYGVLYADDQQSAVILPGSQGSDFAVIKEKAHAGIARYQLDYGARDNIGLLVTSRQSENYFNNLASFDGATYLSEQDQISYQVAYSDTENSDELVSDFDLAKNQSGHALSVKFERDTKAYDLVASYQQIDEDFRSDLGFITKAGYNKSLFGGGYHWYMPKGDAITDYWVSGDFDITYEQHGDRLEKEFEIYLGIEAVYNINSELVFLTRESKYISRYYDENLLDLWFTVKPYGDLKFTFYGRVGDKIDFRNAELGDSLYLNPGMTWDYNDYLQFKLEHTYSEMKLDDSLSFRVNLTDFRINMKFNMQSMLKLVVQYEMGRYGDSPLDEINPISKERDFATQLIYSYKINPQTLFYLGYSDNGYAEDDEQHLKANERTFFTKFSYAWQL
ncbi:carbohydrate binding family 9 domain-containing protein [Pseudoalteromonas sp. G4]|uniref:carbohydrate binding family 9 domain-containing protein n=1 Tax=Pseudoalteromonas sp. G4 TaxID=2992761 RepID=UPI00237EDC3A|nr:DUF5916 domain-containing protein [Pseudoalteromonas sp. G4]MDE3271933.1 carbohydrate binding family 9 domain-containing protein [Pseudoalteromonas sp. G4]